MQKGDYLDAILRSKRTVFTVKDIALMWQEEYTSAARVRLNYYVKKGDLIRLRRGIYAKDKNYSKLELATRIFTPSYVSFETILAKEGIIFQYQTDITIASYLTRNVTIDSQVYSFKKMKDVVLVNQAGITQDDTTATATKERALLDTLYNNTDFHFDNLRSINWEAVSSLVSVYNNKRLAKKVSQLYRLAKLDKSP